MSLTVKNLAKRFGPRVLFSGVTFGLGKGERVALIGPNGAGKTTLMKIIAGQEEAEEGLIEKPKTGSALGYLAQSLQFEAGRTLFEEALEASPDILHLRQEKLALEEAMGKESDAAVIHDLADRYSALLQRYDALGGYAYEGRVARVLKGMGFAESRWEQPVETLSGGEGSQLELCKLLVEEPPLLLLDEPTNHLDIEAVEWLEEYLQSYPGAILLVSHDRYFLERVCTRVLELAHGRIDSYTGGYEKYLEQKAERLTLQQKTYERQQAEIAKLTRFINRWRADSKKATQAKSREKARAKIEVTEVDRPDLRDLALVFQQGQPSWHEVLTVENLAAQIPGRTLFEGVSFRVDRGERLVIIGRNGAGKSTLLKMLIQGSGQSAGDMHWGGQTELGYFAQVREEFPPEASVFESLGAAHPHLTKQQVASLLGAVGFTGAEWERPVGQCSGGEQSRLALAILLASKANVLLLDEPTNHLDLIARESLEEALEAFPGTVICISHDRRFIDRMADKLLLVDGAKTRLIHGNYSHWVWQRAQEALANQPQSAATRPARPASRPAGSAGSSKNGQKSGPNLETVIEEIDRLEREIAACHEALGDPELYKNHLDAQEVQQKLKVLEEDLATWMVRLDTF